MKFKQWIKLDEIQHVSLPEPMEINGVTADSIDFRFEDWSKGYNRPNANSLLVNGKNFFVGSFSAPLKNGWLNVNRESSGPMTQGNLGLAVKLQPDTQISINAKYKPLPHNWFDFAIFYLGNYVVKSPEWPRDKIEMLPADTAEIE